MAVELILVFLIAAAIGGQVNHAIYRFSWTARSISPWMNPPEGASARTPKDRIPIIGWWYLRREEKYHGRAFWVRPFLVEVGFVMGILFLYYFEMNRGLLPDGAVGVTDTVMRWQFVSHVVLLTMMTAATFIDLDEKIIPDAITIPGTLAGFVLATLVPTSLLFAWNPPIPPAIAITVEPIWLTQPNAWPPVLDSARGLLIALMCLVVWVYALLPKTLWYRGGVVKFFRYLVASIVRSPGTKWLGLLLSILVVYTTSIWVLGGDQWKGLLSSIVGMAAAGAVVWSIRCIASPILGQEAMGFGDVTLMAMIGSFLGWQASAVAFFVSPFTGCVIAITQWFLTRSRLIAFGPFLCSGALIVILNWVRIWERWGHPIFEIGFLLPIVFAVGLVMLAIMLSIWQIVKRILVRE